MGPPDSTARIRDRRFTQVAGTAVGHSEVTRSVLLTVTVGAIVDGEDVAIADAGGELAADELRGGGAGRTRSSFASRVPAACRRSRLPGS